MSENGYGEHPTMYGSLTDAQLYGMYRQSVWSGMGEHERQQLLQESVNRAAQERGEHGACEVRFADLDDGVSGEQRGSLILVNREMFVNDRQVSHTENYGTITRDYPTSNINALETVLHENEHAWQNQCVSGEIEGDPQRTFEYRANDFTTSSVEQPDGTYQLGSQYMCGETNYDFYYFQSTERDAYQFSQARTLQIVDGLEKQYGSEESFAEYREELRQTGYQAQLERANQRYGTENFEREVNNTLLNQYYGTNIPVDPQIERAVKEEMTATQDELSKAERQESGTTVAPYTPVTAEEYKSTLHDSVNAYYTHAMNDPSVSNEEAYAETAQMAERQFEAVEAFESEAASGSAGNSASGSLEDGGGLDGGDGMDGGME